MSGEDKEGFITDSDLDSIVINHVLEELGCDNVHDAIRRLSLYADDADSVNTGIRTDVLGVCSMCVKKAICMKHLDESISDLFTNVVDADVEIHLFSCDGFVSKHDDAHVCRNCGGSCTCDHNH